MAIARPEVKENPVDQTKKAEEFAKKNILKYQSEQAELCRQITGGCEVTEEEYKNASQEFQTLLEIPLKKGEPLYILPEFDDNNKVRKELEQLKKIISEGRPYHEFVKNQSYGIIWPIVLRAYLGLKDGFRISMDQMDSILKLAYWNQILESENVPLIEEDNVTLTEAGKKLVSKLFTDAQREKSLKQFLFEMKNEPRSEGYVQIVKLTSQYLRFAAWAMGVRSKNKELTEEELRVVIEDANANGSFCESTEVDIEQAGASMFRALVKGMVPFYRVHFLKIKKDGPEVPCLILPSATMQRVYQHAVNPDRIVNFVRRVGIFSLNVMEEAFDNDYRVGNLVAPATTSMIKEHNHIVSACLAIEHDKYHYYLEGQHSLAFHRACARLKQTLWQIYPDRYSRDIVRTIDREILSTSNLVNDFSTFLHDIFTEDRLIGASICIALVDVIINFEKYGFSRKDAQEILKSSLKANAAIDRVMHVITMANESFAGDISDISFVVAIKFKFKLPQEADFLLKLFAAHQSGLIVCGWRKSLEKGELEPVVLLRNKKGSFLCSLDKVPKNYLELFDNACLYLRLQKLSKQVEIKESGTSFITLLSIFSQSKMMHKRALHDFPREIRRQLGAR